MIEYPNSTITTPLGTYTLTMYPSKTGFVVTINVECIYHGHSYSVSFDCVRFSEGIIVGIASTFYYSGDAKFGTELRAAIESDMDTHWNDQFALFFLNDKNRWQARLASAYEELEEAKEKVRFAEIKIAAIQKEQVQGEQNEQRTDASGD